MSRRSKVWPGAPWFYNQEFYDIQCDNRFLVKIFWSPGPIKDHSSVK